MTRYLLPRSIATLALSGALAGMFLPQAALAQDGDSPFSLEASAGIEYDSNVSVIDIDQNTNAGDYAALLDAGVAFETNLGKSTEINLGYDFSQSLQFEFSEFDIQTHRGTAGIDQELGPVTIGASYMYAQSSLGGEKFLTLQRVDPSISGLIGRTLYLRAVYEYTDKNFKNRDERDATTNAPGLTAFIFLDGTKTFFSLGYQYVDENATLDQYDYTGHTFRARFSHDFSLLSRKAEFDIGWRYETRDYSGITPSIGERRSDDRNRFNAGLKVPLVGSVYTKLEFRHDDYSSNLPSADFKQNVGTLRFGFEL